MNRSLIFTEDIRKKMVERIEPYIFCKELKCESCPLRNGNYRCDARLMERKLKLAETFCSKCGR